MALDCDHQVAPGTAYHYPHQDITALAARAPDLPNEPEALKAADGEVACSTGP